MFKGNLFIYQTRFCRLAAFLPSEKRWRLASTAVLCYIELKGGNAMSKFIAAAIQMASTEDIEENLRQAGLLLEEAAAKGAKLAALPEYENCRTAAYAPEPIKEFRRVKRYQYEMMGIVYPPYADKNILIDFGIVEADE